MVAFRHGHTSKDFQNRALAKLLTGLGAPADYEQRVERKKMDVLAGISFDPDL